MERQYIGARYVPKFADPIEWNDQTSYEALTIVTYLGASYTSKKAVPAGVRPTDNGYWAVTGNYNAQVEEYRQQTILALEKANEVEAKLSKYERSRLSGKNILVVGDSISDETVKAPNWVHYFRQRMEAIGGSVTNIAVGGHGISQQFEILKTTDTSNIDIIILLLGINNMGVDYGTTRDDIGNMCAYIHNNINKEAHWITPTTTTEFTHANAEVLQSSLSDLIANTCKMWGINVIDGAAFPLLSPSNRTYLTDKLHPDSSYAPLMCDYIFECVAHYSGGYFTKMCNFYRVNDIISLSDMSGNNIEYDTVKGYYQEFGGGVTMLSFGVSNVQLANAGQSIKVNFENTYLARIIGYGVAPIVSACAYSNNLGPIKVHSLCALFNSTNIQANINYVGDIDLWSPIGFESGEILESLKVQVLMPANSPLLEQKQPM